jgi:hypothetical protein
LGRFSDLVAEAPTKSFLLYFRQLAVPKLVKPAGSATPKRGSSVSEIPEYEMTSREFRQNGEIVKIGI